MNNSTVVKITVFREFAATLAGQVVEQLCGEYEREVTVMYNDLVQQRQELARVAELLGHQLGREKQLHEMLENMSQHHVNLGNHHQQVASTMQPASKDIHDALDRTMGQQVQISATVMQNMSQAHAVTQQNVMNAKQLQEPLINAENEFNRIMQLLSVPLMSMATPQPTMAKLPGVQPALVRMPAGMGAPMTPPASPYAGSPYAGMGQPPMAPFAQPGMIAGSSPVRLTSSPRSLGQQRPAFA